VSCVCESLATVAVIETFYEPSNVVEPVTSPAKLIVLAVCNLDYVEALPESEPYIVFALIFPFTSNFSVGVDVPIPTFPPLK